MTKSLIVIPARYASTRLPRKLLLAETGKPLIQHTYEAAQRATLPSGVLVACDHDEIEAAVRSFGGDVVRTDPNAASGTDRVAEAVASRVDIDIVVNVQGDEPDLSGEAIDSVVKMLESRPDAQMATLATPIRSRQKLDDPSCVKVVVASLGAPSGEAIYFSRSVIPHPREWDDSLLTRTPPVFLQHIGLYAYRREFLLTLTKLPPSPLELIERLEQLRVLELGEKILVGVVEEASIGIDTPEDYRAFVAGKCTERHPL
ncbi:MAG: 3-deoxy-manno-octulosonate cytidylyltransferase [Thermoguttaceae bacterium]